MAAAPRIPDLLLEMFQRVDDQLVAGWYRALSVPTDRVRRHLRAAHRPFVDPDGGELPALDDLDRTAAWLIEQTSARATAIGGVAGLAGLASVPPEAAATVVAIVRLAQRLAVVYGFDPETDRGQMALTRALAAGFEVELPERGQVGMRFTDLPAVIAPGLVRPRTVGSDLAGRVVRQALGMIVARITRVVPVFSAGSAASDGRRRVREVGERMRLVLRQLAEVPIAAIPSVEDAVEI